MPDISNEDLMYLIHRVIKKVDLIEEKLDRVLERCRFLPKTLEFGEVDNFRFKPINSEEELQQVSEKILEDEEYQRYLLLLLDSKENFTLMDLFTTEFLFDYNLTGIKGKKKLEGLVPYENIYVYLKSQRGENDYQIKMTVMKEFKGIKNRIHRREHFYRQREAKKENETEKRKENSREEDTKRTKEDHDYVSNAGIDYELKEEEEWTEDEDSEIETKVTLTPNLNKVVVEEIPPDDDDDQSDDMIEEVESYDGSMDGQSEASIIEPSSLHQSDNEDDDEDFIFNPIRDENQLKKVTQKIKSNPRFLKQLRLQIVEDSNDGKITLKQLFTADFIDGYNLSGIRGKKKLIDLAIYKSVYLYLKRHLGISLKEIEKEATHELNKMKNSIHVRTHRHKYLNRKKAKELANKFSQLTKDK